MVDTVRRVVYKYEVKCCNCWKELSVPKGAVILSATCKQPVCAGDGILIYAEVDPQQAAHETFCFLAIGTGRAFELEENMHFLGTIQIPAPLNEVYHVYYVKA